MPEAPKLSASLSCSQRVGLPNYGSADLFLSISGVTVDTSEAEIDELLDATKLVYAKIAARIREKVAVIRGEGGI